MPTRIKVAEISDIPPGSSKFVDADGLLLALFNIDGVFYALDDACPHQGAPLSEGEIRGCVVVCPWHGWEFDVTSGKRVNPFGAPNTETYRVVVEGNDVMIDL
ncbi:MAG: non-heme iron oxygenase ferredoxin subunit [Planctomycetales bacterium]|nr:non-heme iron oxygenase ferredoxin subunit [Planctomycetales bacterium]